MSKEKRYVSCPFCGEDDFDLAGLKTHFHRGYCEHYNATEVYEYFRPTADAGGGDK